LKTGGKGFDKNRLHWQSKAGGCTVTGQYHIFLYQMDSMMQGGKLHDAQILEKKSAIFSREMGIFPQI